MSRSGYAEDGEMENWELIRWRGAVASAIRGKRGQSFLLEMIEALDSLPQKRLLENVLVCEDGCCAMGAVAIKRRIDVSAVDAAEPAEVASAFGIAQALAQEIAWENDYRYETPEARFDRVRAWVVDQISKVSP